MKYLKSALVAVCLGALPGLLSAQFNMKAAYRLVVTDAQAFNEIVSRHEEEFDVFEDGELVRAYTDGFGELRIMHGFDLGIRQRFGSFALEGNWFNRRRQLRADGQRANGNSFENRITTTINSASLALQQHIGQFHLSGSLDYNFLRIKSEFEQPAFTRTIKDNAWGSTFSIAYNFKSNGIVSFSLQPYVQVYWEDYDLAEFDQTLNGSPSNQSVADNFFNWGIAFVIYNGYQR